MQLRIRDKEHFFHDLSQMLRSGIALQRALEHMGTGRGRIAAAARAAGSVVNEGLEAALSSSGFSELDIGILTAGEQSGRLEEACRALADYYAHLEKGRNRALAASAYPVFILHLGAILLSIAPAVVEGSFPVFLREAGLFLGMAYLAVASVAAVLWITARGFSSKDSADRVVSMIPIVGGLLRCAALARFCLVLSLGIRSAEGFLSGLKKAGTASGSARIRTACGQAVTSIRSGNGFATAMRSTGAFPEDLERALQVAEVSGRLEEEITRWAGIYRERLFQRIDAIAAWLPRALYLLIVLLVVLRMFSLISEITGAYSQVLEM